MFFELILESIQISIDSNLNQQTLAFSFRLPKSPEDSSTPQTKLSWKPHISAWCDRSKKFASRFNCASRRKPRNYTVRVGIIFMLMKRNSCGKAIFLLEKITKTVLLAYRESLTFSNQLLIASHAFCKWASAIAGSRCDVITVQFIGTCRPP